MENPAGNSVAAVEVEGLTRRFGSVTALDAVSLRIRQGEFFSLLGPSGCGKTTLLRILAGLEVEDAGEVRIEGVGMRGVPAHRRPVNTVFQSYALFPHLDVRDNVGFGLRMKGVVGAERMRRVDAVMELLELGGLAGRRPLELSGGQRQRVALARAIVNEPRVLLLDEPMAALDLKLRRQVQGELRGLQRRLGITFLLVTHDQEEALVLSDRLAVMRAGGIEQVGHARETYERPRTRFVAEFLGTCSLLEARRLPEGEARCEGGFLADTPLGRLQVAGEPPSRERFTLAIRPERVLPGDQGGNGVRAKVRGVTYVGSATQYVLEASGVVVRLETLNAGSENPSWGLEAEVGIRLPAEALVVLDD